MRFINLKTRVEESCVPCPTVLCIGNFDGVHLGHRQLVNAVLEKYESLKKTYTHLTCGAWFFDSNFYKNTVEIYSLDEKLDVFASLGLEYAIIADFNDMKSLSPDEFVVSVLQDNCKCIHAVCGENFRFGSKASGTSHSLVDLMHGNATIVPLMSVKESIDYENDIVVSSTYIRSLLADGHICRANHLLGRNYSILEPVVHGKALGRTLGIPTINQNVNSKQLILKNGIYATDCTINGRKYLGVTNVGVRPTVEENGRKNIETHIIDFDGDCYDQYVKVEFMARIRDEMKFDTIEDLKAQIKLDINKTREIFIHN